jgi:hypothetical protein
MDIQELYDGTDEAVKSILDIGTFKRIVKIWLESKPTEYTSENMNKWFRDNYPDLQNRIDAVYSVRIMQEKEARVLQKRLDYNKKRPKDFLLGLHGIKRTDQTKDNSLGMASRAESLRRMSKPKEDACEDLGKEAKEK